MTLFLHDLPAFMSLEYGRLVAGAPRLAVMHAVDSSAPQHLHRVHPMENISRPWLPTLIDKQITWTKT
jgi:hypothetical protein